LRVFGANAKFNRIESLALAQWGNIVGKWGAIAKANTALHWTQVRLGLRLRPLLPVNSAVMPTATIRSQLPEDWHQ